MSNSKMKKKKNRLSIGLIIIILIVLIAVGINHITNKEKKNEIKEQNVIEQTQQENEIKEEYIQLLQDGSKLNISEKLKENRKIGSLILKDIQLTYKDGVTILLANVENTSKETSKQKEVEITLVNEKEEKIYTLQGVIEKIEPGETKQLNASITADFANAYNFTIKEK